MDQEHETIQPITFSITLTQLNELVEYVNYASLDRRKEIARERNGNAFNNEILRRDHWIIVLNGHTKPHGSAYVENIYVDLDAACEIINSCLTVLKTIKMFDYKFKIPELSKMGPLKKRIDVAILNVGERIFDVQRFDDIVKQKLEQCYIDITGERPTMGGYKKTQGLAGPFLPARGIKTPFSVFALRMIEFAGLRRLNGEEFTINVLKNAASKLPEQPDADTDCAACALVIKPKSKGRPAKGFSARDLETAEPFEFEVCSDLNLFLLKYLDRRDSKRSRLRRKKVRATTYHVASISSLACCRFRGHRDWVFHEAGGGICSDGNLGVSSRSRRFA